jgi:phosphate/sulfate permease
MTGTVIGASRLARQGDESPRAQSFARIALRIVREPLLQFLVAGGVLFLAARLHADATDHRRIAVSPDRVAAIEETWRQQYGSPPAASVLEALTQKWIEEEILYREGVARGVDREDEIIRRRVIQKMQFLTQDLTPAAAPREADLKAFYRSHADLYRSPPRVSFSHLFFNPDRGGEAAARERAERILTDLPDETSQGPRPGDPFADRYDYAGLGPADLARLFGHTPMADAPFGAPLGRWSGPYRSGFGWHLLRLDSRTPSSLFPFAAVADKVRSDWLAEQKAKDDAQAFAELRRRYQVVRDDRGAAR